MGITRGFSIQNPASIERELKIVSRNLPIEQKVLARCPDWEDAWVIYADDLGTSGSFASDLDPHYPKSKLHVFYQRAFHAMQRAHLFGRKDYFGASHLFWGSAIFSDARHPALALKALQESYPILTGYPHIESQQVYLLKLLYSSWSASDTGEMKKAKKK